MNKITTAKPHHSVTPLIISPHDGGLLQAQIIYHCCQDFLICVSIGYSIHPLEGVMPGKPNLTRR